MAYKLLYDDELIKDFALDDFTLVPINDYNEHETYAGLITGDENITPKDFPVYYYPLERKPLKHTLCFKTFIYHAFLNIDTFNQLQAFQANNKYFFMMLNQTKQKKLGQIVSNSIHAFKTMKNAYHNTLCSILSDPLQDKTFINTFSHMVGYFKKSLDQTEKKLVSDAVKAFETGAKNQHDLLMLIASFTVKYHEPYLKKQTLLTHYLMDSPEGANICLSYTDGQN